ncbi:LexA repressor, putative [Cyanobium sp. PCC 7001]|uniref:LexA family protein n=1 Tax=Cyanobium sp. PCC 7001 TaxID=180281 RepID=UPI0001805D09|nr:S24 family peptidase [Cyanobium sp. PCC 7001]EDY38386.1 LexA repressor, putative [Cyanobium sp. PCC 7001]
MNHFSSGDPGSPSEATGPAAIGPAAIGPVAIDLQRLLLPDPRGCLLLRVAGESMRDAGIHHGDLLIVDRRLEPRPGLVVVALLEEGFTVKRLAGRGTRLWLEAAHPAYPALPLPPDPAVQLWGVATHVIHHC